MLTSLYTFHFTTLSFYERYTNFYVWLLGDEHTPYTSTATADPKASMDAFDAAKVSDCIQTFQDVFGVLHPIPCLNNIQAQSSHLLRAAQRSLWSVSGNSGACGLNEMFKMIIAIAEVCNEGSQTPLSRTLYQSIEPVLNNAAFSRTVTHEFRILLLLVVRCYRRSASITS